MKVWCCKRSLFPLIVCTPAFVILSKGSQTERNNPGAPPSV